MSAEDNTIELSSIVNSIVRHKWMIIGSVVICTLLAYLMVSNIAPKYSARSSVMLDPRTVQVLSSDNVVSDLTLNNPLLDSEVAVLRSNILLEQVIQSFDKDRLAAYDPINQPLSFTAKLKRSLRRLVSSETNAGTTAVAATDPEELRVKRLVNALRRDLTVWRVGQSYLISMSVVTEDPELSMLFANRVAQTYIDRQIADRVGVIEGATTFLSERVEEMRKDVESAEAEIEDFRTNQLARLGLSESTIEKQLLELSTQLAMARADRAQAVARYDQIQTVINQTGIEEAAELLTSTIVVSLRQQMTELVRADAELATRFSENHPDRQRIRAEIDTVSTDLTQEVRKIVATMRNEVEVARIREDSISRSVSDVEQRAAQISRANLELRQLEREAEAVRNNYEDMLDRLNETQSTERLQRADAKLVERAVTPGAPSEPRVLLFTVFGATLGLTLGLIATFLTTVGRRGFAHTHEIEESTGLPVIGSLVKGDWRTPTAMLRGIRNDPYQPFAERLRQLRTALAMRQTDSEYGQSLIVTSSVANEGKTSTALALAHLEVLSKKSCVVVDFDLRRSSLAKLFGYKMEADLADVLLNGEPVERAVYKVPGLGFDLISLRRPAPQLVDLCSEKVLRAFIEDLKRRYDFVIIDTAPLLLVADTLRLTTLSDYVLLLVRNGTTRRRAVMESARTLEEMGAKSIAAVMTMTDVQSEKENYGLESYYR